jgi:hypothetical protein
VRTARVLGVTLLLLPVLAWAYLAFVDPRPFYIAEDDPEHITFYTARLIESGRKPFDLHMPGLTTSYVAVASNALSGGRLDNPQALFSWLRFLSALFTGIVLYSVARFSFRTTPTGVWALALSPMVAWPSFLLFFDYFDPNSIQLPLGLLTLALFWGSLTTPRPSLRRLGLCGVMLGVCLATKFTFVPLAVAMVCATAIHVALAKGHIVRRSTPLIVLVAATGATFVAFAIPIIDEIPSLFLGLMFSEQTRPRSWEFHQWLTGWRTLSAINGPATLVILAAVAFFMVRLIVIRPVAQENIATQAFLLLMLMGLAYTMAAAEDEGINGRGLRLAEPTALCVSFLIVYCFHIIRRHRNLAQSYAFQVALIALAVWVVVPALIQRSQERHAFVASHTAIVEKTGQRLLSLKRPGTRVAVWDGSSGSLLGEESFHFWGNYQYACDTFDEELLQMYPDYAFFRLREVPRIVLGERGVGAQADRGGSVHVPGSALGWPGRLWRTVFQRTNDCRRSDEIVAGEFSGVQVSLIAIPKAEAKVELEGRGLTEVTEPELIALIERRFGPAVLRRESIAGVDWILIEVSERQSSTTAPLD